MTDQAKVNAAVVAMQQATVTPKTWAERIRTGYPAGHPYNYPATYNFKAQQALWDAVHAAPPPPPPPPAPLEAARSWIVLADNPMDALNSPPYYKLALTADLGYRQWYTPSFFAAAHEQGRVMAPWCDCQVESGYHPGVGTGPDVAYQMAHDYGLQPPLGQGENGAQGDIARKAGMKIIMGKIGEQSSTTQASVSAQAVLWIEEDYWNCGAGERDWHNNPGVAGALVAVYKDGQCAGMPFPSLLQPGAGSHRFIAHQDSVYGPQMTVEWYKAMP